MSFLRFMFGVSACCWLLSCGNTGAEPVDYGPLLEKVSEQVILPEQRAFEDEADALVVLVQALESSPDADTLLAAQQGWRKTRRSFRVLDALHFGPNLTSRITERIDVSPVDANGIETLVAGTAAVDDAAVRAAGGQKKGFLGLEYLLFSAAASAPPALAEDEFAPRRRALALGIAHEIAQSAHQLDDLWEGDDGGFIEQVKLAGAGGTRYATQRAAVDDLVGGCSYALELVVGIRLAMPLGRKTGGVPDPTLDPTARSDSAVADMQASLAGVFAAYSGDGLGTVIAKKSAPLDGVVEDEFSDGQTKLAAIPAPFALSVVNDTALVQSAYDSLRALKATWNTDVASALGATVKVGDNDGD